MKTLPDTNPLRSLAETVTALKGAADPGDRRLLMRAGLRVASMLLEGVAGQLRAMGRAL